MALLSVLMFVYESLLQSVALRNNWEGRWCPFDVEAGNAWEERVPNHKAILFDEGDNRISSTSFAAVGKAIAAILKNLEGTKNRVVRVSEVILTQNQLLQIAGRLRPDDDWEISKVASSALLKEGLEEFAAGDFSFPVISKIIKGTALAGERYGSAYDETDNELLGVTEMSEEDLTKIMVEKLKQD